MIPHMPTVNAPTPQYQNANNPYKETISAHKTLKVERERRERKWPEMDLGTRGWNELGVVGTIYEEEDEISASSSFSTMPSLESSPSHTPQLSIEENPWFSGRRHDQEDVVIHVQGKCFRLHKQALMAKSAYLKRQLSELSEITLSPPLNITAQTFALVADFCYGTHVAVTPFNVAALRTAAELLGMTETGGAGGENLQQITEAYFSRIVGVNKECASIVLQSCFPLLPEAETAAALVSRCIEALSLMAEADVDAACLDGFKNVRIDDLKLILESVSQRLTDRHDFVYKIIDIYLKKNNGAIPEDGKIQMCNYIDCSILSAGVLMHAVQNPRMPLRFVVQAMFLQQLNTRHSIISAADNHHHHNRLKLRLNKKEPAVTTLGAILERDAALRQVSQLKSIMSATNTRIQTLEEELTGMRKLLNEPDSVKNRLDSGRSASFRFSSDTNKIERGQTGSVSSLSYRDVVKKVRTEGSSSSEGSSEGSPSFEKSIGRKLINGLKSAFFRLQKKKCESKGPVKNGDNLGNEVIIIRKDQAFHKRSLSQF